MPKQHKSKSKCPSRDIIQCGMPGCKFLSYSYSLNRHVKRMHPELHKNYIRIKGSGFAPGERFEKWCPVFMVSTYRRRGIIYSRDNFRLFKFVIFCLDWWCGGQHVNLYCADRWRMRLVFCAQSREPILCVLASAVRSDQLFGSLGRS